MRKSLSNGYEKIVKTDAHFTPNITGFVGGAPPIGHKQTITHIIIDEDLLPQNVLWASANAVFRLNSSDIESLTMAKSLLSTRDIMRKIFWDNPYQSDLETRVVSVENNYVLFEETIAFSFSGGQESDHAYVNGFPIVDSKIDGNLIYYVLPDGHNLKPGDVVVMNIDWPRRYRLMRLHFAAELILELVTRELKLEKIGAHIAESKARIDFFFDKNISFLFESMLSDYNKIIQQDLTIKTGFSDLKNQRRFWEIEGFSKVACGGTHVKSTSEVGFIALKRINIGGGKERIEIKLLHDNLG